MRNDPLIKQVREIRNDAGVMPFTDQGKKWQSFLPSDWVLVNYSIFDFLPAFSVNIFDPDSVSIADFVEAFAYYCRYTGMLGHYNHFSDTVVFQGLDSYVVSRKQCIMHFIHLRNLNPVFILTLAEKLLPDQFGSREMKQERLF